ncbi:membrane protein [Paucilactobacillus hokkaidonensis JCM 18461]|uniref:Membrane protein n=2 Tax=Paucilactobacillus hokkaidonensis TaxID=1193095 RepID=A0A0A1GTS8_9LACO|nr:hypothetical protein [Paucilactobacillus hokkaidonensis]KRO10650.1 hypothetical protein IV59_GL001341 [Paucilactobacillus hokkaidonensis]BAP85642.1 membrane protein [Paucilactobacillus hokkaidonensis JCM 18461]
MQQNKTTTTVTTIIFIAIIYLISLFQFHVSSPIGDPFVQLGEVFGILGILFLGLKLGLVSSLVGILLANIMTNPQFFYLPMFEMLLIALVANFLFKILGRQARWTTLITVALGCGITKIITTFLHYFIQAIIVSGGRTSIGVMTAFTAMPAGIITAILLVIIVPIMYFMLQKTIFKNFD